MLVRFMPSKCTQKSKKKEKIPPGKNLRLKKNFEVEDNLKISLNEVLSIKNKKSAKIRIFFLLSFHSLPVCLLVIHFYRVQVARDTLEV